MTRPAAEIAANIHRRQGDFSKLDMPHLLDCRRAMCICIYECVADMDSFCEGVLAVDSELSRRGLKLHEIADTPLPSTKRKRERENGGPQT